MLTPIAVDVTCAWMVLPDGGTPLGEQVSGPDLVEACEEVLSQYGELQRDLAPHADRLLDLGVVDMRAAVMPQRFDEALEAVGRYVERRDKPDERATSRAVAGLRTTLEAWCERLASAPVPRASTTTTCTPGTSSSAQMARRGSTTGATAWSRTRSRAC